MKNKYHFTIRFADLNQSKQIEILNSIEEVAGLDFLPAEDRVDDPDYTDDKVVQLVRESCEKSWCEWEVVING